jgi:methyltransferase (TIGR00027 family)
MAKAAAQTGAGPTFMVAVEQHFPPQQRLIDDAVAGMILPAGGRAFARLMRARPLRQWLIRSIERSTPGVWGGLIGRKRYIDDKLAEAAGAVGAVLNLGAGFDTRACRLDCLVGVPVWEVDQPQNIAAKRARLRRIYGGVPAGLSLVAIDFDREDLQAVLAAAGYPLQTRSFFIWEGVSQYLTAAGVQASLEFFARAAPGSRLAFTYVRRDFVEGRELHGQPGLYRRFVAPRRIWLHGIEPEQIDHLLSSYGWRTLEHLGFEELGVRYIRPRRPELASTPVERMVYAEKIA